MTSSFMSLNTALEGLMAAQTAINTATHNIDNANTPGYSREAVNLAETSPIIEFGSSTIGPIELGTGVQSESIIRYRDSFLDSQYWSQNQFLGQAQEQQTTLTDISGIVNEPSDTGISDALTSFWSAWTSLQENPTELSAQTEVQQAGITLAQTINQTYNQLEQLRQNIIGSSSSDGSSSETGTLSATVNQANSLISQIANVTQEIEKQQDDGVTPNDLLDQRDELLDQLSSITSVTVADTPADEASTGTGSDDTGSPATTGYQVYVGGVLIVSDGTSGTLSVGTDSNGAACVNATPPGSSTATQITETANTASGGGSLQGIIDSLGYVNEYEDDLNNLASALASSVNGVESGYFAASDGSSDITAANISVGITDPSDIDAGTDGETAEEVSNLKTTSMSFPDPSDSTKTITGTIDDYLQSAVSKLGTESQTADNNVTTYQSLVQQVDTERQSVSGVSLDEEMTNVIEFQQAYSASAKMISTINDMLQTLMENV